MTFGTAVMIAAVSLAGGSAFARLPEDATVPNDSALAVIGPASVFGSLKESPDRSIPAAVGRAIALMPSSPAGLAIDPSQVHRRSVAGRNLFVAPMTDGLCVFIEDGSSVCSQDLGEITKNGLWLAVIPPTPGRIDPASPPAGIAGSGQTTIYGVAPDGVQAVDAITAAGSRVTSTVEGNAFVIVADRPVVSVSLRR